MLSHFDFLSNHERAIRENNYSVSAKRNAAALCSISTSVLSAFILGSFILVTQPWKALSPDLSVGSVVAVYVALFAISPLFGAALGVYERTERTSIKLRSVCKGFMAFSLTMGFFLFMISLMIQPSPGSITNAQVRNIAIGGLAVSLVIGIAVLILSMHQTQPDNDNLTDGRTLEGVPLIPDADNQSPASIEVSRLGV